jgi:hypothetical protein
VSQDFQPGDFLVFQLESGFAVLRLLALDPDDEGYIWHLAGYDEFFPDVDSAEAAIAGDRLSSVSHPHIALSQRAFESTPVARLGNKALDATLTGPLDAWRADPDREVSDRSVRLMLGLR